MPAGSPNGRAEGASALVAEETVLRDDVVDLEAIGASVALADVALEKRFARDQVGALAIAEQARWRRTAARLTRRGRLGHFSKGG